MSVNINNTTKINPSSTEPVEEEKTIDSLGPEILQECLGYLNTRNDLQSTVQVSHFWKNATIETSRFKERSLARGFGEFLTENLHPIQCSEQIETLANICKSNTILNSVNLLDLKSSLLDLKEKIISALRTLDIETICALEAQSATINIPHFFEDIFELTVASKEIDMKIEAANNLPLEWRRCDALYTLWLDLMQKNNIDKAIEVANIVSNEYQRDSMLKDICLQLTLEGNIDRTIDVANAITREPKRDYMLAGICKRLTSVGDINRAIEVANAITDKYKRRDMFEGICKRLTLVGGIDRAVEVANSFTDEYERNNQIELIIKDLIQQGNGFKAVRIAKTFGNESLRYPVFKYSCKAFMQRGNVAGALQLVNDPTLTKSDRNYLVEVIICKELIRQNDIQRAVEILVNHDDDVVMSAIRLDTILSELIIDEGYIDENNEVANISQNLRERGDFRSSGNIFK